jgi:5-methylcytosine-specific restriction endonuclease McrA
MNKETYRKLLRDPKWKEKSSYIKRRDNHTCQNCGKTDCVLDVHHKNYILGKNPWEIPSRYLITLCRSCHKKEHTNKKISEFFITLQEFREKRKEITKNYENRKKYKKHEKRKKYRNFRK